MYGVALGFLPSNRSTWPSRPFAIGLFRSGNSIFERSSLYRLGQLTQDVRAPVCLSVHKTTYGPNAGVGGELEGSQRVSPILPALGVALFRGHFNSFGATVERPSLFRSSRPGTNAKWQKRSTPQ